MLGSFQGKLQQGTIYFVQIHSHRWGTLLHRKALSFWDAPVCHSGPVNRAMAMSLALPQALGYRPEPDTVPALQPPPQPSGLSEATPSALLATLVPFLPRGFPSGHHCPCFSPELSPRLQVWSASHASGVSPF